VSLAPFGLGFSGMESTDPMWYLEERMREASELVDRLRLFLGMVAPSRAHFCFARHDHCSSTSSCGLDFRMVGKQEVMP
jgi:hypothetical protein